MDLAGAGAFLVYLGFSSFFFLKKSSSSSSSNNPPFLAGALDGAFFYSTLTSTTSFFGGGFISEVVALIPPSGFEGLVYDGIGRGFDLTSTGGAGLTSGTLIGCFGSAFFTGLVNTISSY